MPPRMVLRYLDATEVRWLMKHYQESPILSACRVVQAWCLGWSKKR